MQRRQETKRVDERVAVVTGASSGFGLLTTIALAEEGYRVFGTVRSAQKQATLESAAQAAGVEVEVVELELTDSESIKAAIAEVEGKTEGIHVLVNNAGIAIGGFFEDMTMAEIRAQFDANVFGAMEVIRAVLPGMRARHRGKIINVSSIGGRLGNPGLAAYCSSKWAIEGLTEALRFELKPYGIEVGLVEPGTFKTEIWSDNRKAAAAAYSPTSPYAKRTRALEQFWDQNLANNQSDPAEVAQVIAKLCRKRKLPARTPVGTDAKLVSLLRSWLPMGLFERVLQPNLEPNPPKDTLPTLRSS